MLHDIFTEWEKRNYNTNLENDIKNLLEYIKNNLDSIDPAILGNIDNYNNFLESENINTSDIIEKAFFAGVQAAENEINQRIAAYNESIETIKEEINIFHTCEKVTAADKMQALYNNIESMNIFNQDKNGYYIIEKIDTYKNTCFYFSDIYHDKKSALKAARKREKETSYYNNNVPVSVYKVYHVLNGVYTEIKTKNKKTSAA